MNEIFENWKYPKNLISDDISYNINIDDKEDLTR